VHPDHGHQRDAFKLQLEARHGVLFEQKADGRMPIRENADYFCLQGK